jgi:hypothetical protein
MSSVRAPSATALTQHGESFPEYHQVGAGASRARISPAPMYAAHNSTTRNTMVDGLEIGAIALD